MNDDCKPRYGIAGGIYYYCCHGRVKRRKKMGRDDGPI